MNQYSGQSLEQRHQKPQSYGRRLTPLEKSGREEDILETYAHMSGSQTTKDTAHQTNHFWKPLVNLVTQLALLESMIFHSFGQFPPCLLSCLHQHRPQYRLYIT
jgi:hypothetical protein